MYVYMCMCCVFTCIHIQCSYAMFAVFEATSFGTVYYYGVYYVCEEVCMYVSMYVCEEVYVCMYVKKCMYVYMCMCCVFLDV